MRPQAQGQADVNQAADERRQGRELARSEHLGRLAEQQAAQDATAHGVHHPHQHHPRRADSGALGELHADDGEAPQADGVDDADGAGDQPQDARLRPEAPDDRAGQRRPAT